MIWMMERVKNLSGNYAKLETKFALLEFRLVKKEMLPCYRLELTPFVAKWNLIGFKNLFNHVRIFRTRRGDSR